MEVKIEISDKPTGEAIKICGCLSSEQWSSRLLRRIAREKCLSIYEEYRLRQERRMLRFWSIHTIAFNKSIELLMNIKRWMNPQMKISKTEDFMHSMEDVEFITDTYDQLVRVMITQVNAYMRGDYAQYR